MSHGLTIVTTMDLTRETYEFNLFAIFYDAARNKYYVGHDSGCSCPVPWENHTSRDDFDGPMTFQSAQLLLDTEARTNAHRNEGWFVDGYASSRRVLREHAGRE